MDDTIQRMVENIVARTNGPMKFRFYLQPLMALIFAVIDGRKDAKAGKPAYFWALFTDAANRQDMLRSGWKSVGKIFIIAVVLDAVYQFKVLGWFYPGEALVVAFALAIVPYLLLRGPVNRLMARKGKE